MANESLEQLGFRDADTYSRLEHPNTIDPREKKGFVAGLGVKSS